MSRFTAMRIMSHLSLSWVDPATQPVRHPGTANSNNILDMAPLSFCSVITLLVQVIPGCMLVPIGQVKIAR